MGTGVIQVLLPSKQAIFTERFSVRILGLKILKTSQMNTILFLNPGLAATAPLQIHLSSTPLPLCPWQHSAAECWGLSLAPTSQHWLIVSKRSPIWCLWSHTKDVISLDKKSFALVVWGFFCCGFVLVLIYMECLVNRDWIQGELANSSYCHALGFLGLLLCVILVAISATNTPTLSPLMVPCSYARTRQDRVFTSDSRKPVACMASDWVTVKFKPTEEPAFCNRKKSCDLPQ